MQQIQQGTLTEIEEVVPGQVAENNAQDEEGQAQEGAGQQAGIAEPAVGKGKKERKKKGKAAEKAAEKVAEKQKLEERQKRLQQQLLQQRAALQRHAEQQRSKTIPAGAPAEYYVLADQAAEDEPSAPITRDDKGNGRMSGNSLGQPGPSWAQGAAWQPPPPQQYAWPPMGWQQPPQPPPQPPPQQPPQQPQAGGWVWQSAEEKKKKKKKRAVQEAAAEETESEEEKEEDSEEEEKAAKKKKKREKNWEKETKKQRTKRHRKYEKMSESNDSDKQSVKHQVGAMFRSVIAQEKVVEHLRALQYEDATEEQLQSNKDLLDEVLAARKDLVDRIKYLEVAYDYDWDAAKVFLEMRDENPSSIVLKAVSESKKRKAVTKKEPEEKKKKKEHGGSSGGTAPPWRGQAPFRSYQPPAPQQYWQPMPQYAGFPAAPTPTYPPAAPYGRQAGSFRPQRPPGCFNCGDASHGFRRCPNAAPTPPPPRTAPPPPPPT